MNTDKFGKTDNKKKKFGRGKKEVRKMEKRKYQCPGIEIEETLNFCEIMKEEFERAEPEQVPAGEQETTQKDAVVELQALFFRK